MEYIDQAEWGSRTEYPDDPSFEPRYIVIHWGGLTDYVPPEGEARQLKGWQRYHMDSKGWSDIAYNFAIGDSGRLYRLRGYNRGGHTKGTTPEGDSYNSASLGIVWIGGKKAGTPSAEAFDAMSSVINELGLQVRGHRTVKIENNSWTQCPGDEWLEYIVNRGWEMSDFKPPKKVFEKSWAAALKAGIVSEEYSDPWDNVDKQELMEFFYRMGLISD